MPKFVDRLKQARKALWTTVEQAAEAAGVDSRQTIYNWEKGEGSPTAQYLRAMAKEGISPAWLLLNRGDMWAAAASEAEWRLQIIREVAVGGDVKALLELLDDLGDFAADDSAD